MEVHGKVMSISLTSNIKKKDGGTYPGWRLVYENSDGEVKTIEKHENSLKYAAALKNGLESLAVGDSFTMEMEKKDGFWNPTSVYKSGATPKKDTNAPQQATQRSAPSSGGNSYPTADERAQTQKYIVRQSSITNALKLLELNGNKKATTQEAIEIAAQFEGWVFGKVVDAKVKEDQPTGWGGLEDMEDDIPL